MKKRLFPVALMACTVILSACSKNDGNDTSKSQADKFEDYSMTTEWINYTVAASSELLDDCIALWASWNGPTGIRTKIGSASDATFSPKTRWSARTVMPNT